MKIIGQNCTDGAPHSNHWADNQQDTGEGVQLSPVLGDCGHHVKRHENYRLVYEERQPLFQFLFPEPQNQHANLPEATTSVPSTARTDVVLAILARSLRQMKRKYSSKNI